MAWTDNEPDKTTKTGATGADVTKANLMHLHNVLDYVLWHDVGGTLTAGFNAADAPSATNTLVRGFAWTTKTAAYTAKIGENIMVNTTLGAVTIHLYNHRKMAVEKAGNILSCDRAIYV